MQILQRHHFASHLKRMSTVVRVQDSYFAFVKVRVTGSVCLLIYMILTQRLWAGCQVNTNGFGKWKAI